MRTLLALAALLAYCALAHGSVLAGEPWVTALIAVLACVAVLCASRAYQAMLLLGAVLAGWAIAAGNVVGFELRRLADAAIYLPSIFMIATLALVFGRSLLPGRTPLLTAIATIVRGELGDRAQRYTRAITWLWTVVMLLLALECVLLALFAPMPTWSLFANGINYIIIAAVFVAEYLFRRRWLSELSHPGFADFMRNLGRADVRAALDRR